MHTAHPLTGIASVMVRPLAPPLPRRCVVLPANVGLFADDERHVVLDPTFEGLDDGDASSVELGP
jgi:hypothetical protein